jgi:TonB family protein
MEPPASVNKSDAPGAYALSDDLARLCLPQEYRDSYRGLAWVNSVCLLFLVIGLIGLNPPPIAKRELPPLNEIIPIVIEQPDEPPEPETKTENEPPPETTEIITDQPVVATVVAANPANVAFALPVKGPVILAPAKFAAPPAREIRPTQNTSTVTKLTRDEEDWGGRSEKPEYPSLAQRRGYQGKVLLEIGFDANGAVASVTVKVSSGYTLLDEAAILKVKNDLRLRTPPGQPRIYTKEFTFQLR